MSFKSIVEMFKYDSSEQPFVEEAMRLEKADEIMSEIEARTQALQERLAKHGTHDQETHGGKDSPKPRPTRPAPKPDRPKPDVPLPTNPAKPDRPKPSPKPERPKPERPKPDKTLPRNPNRPSPEQEAIERMKQELEEKKKKDEAARRKLEEQMGQVKKEQGIKLGSMVTWGSSGGTAKGKVVRITKGSLNVPDSSFTIKGEEDNPAVLIRIYKDGKPTDKMVGHKMDTLRKM
jgi:DNA-binding protein H-NS